MEAELDVDPAGADEDVEPDEEVGPDADDVPDEDDEPDADDVPDAEGAALAGAATVRTVPPMAAGPNTNTAAVLARRVLMISVPFLRGPMRF